MHCQYIESQHFSNEKEERNTLSMHCGLLTYERNEKEQKFQQSIANALSGAMRKLIIIIIEGHASQQ